jgi:hydantoinase/carbamoylase family amidase
VSARGEATPRAERVLERLERLFALGPEPHANRPGLSTAEQAAIELAAGWMRHAGLRVSVDGAGNLVGRLAGREPDLPEVWAGSHLDTVPAGGRFDGALGVVAAIDAIEALAELGPHKRTLAVVAFRDEEGWRFGQGLYGSRALCGRLEPGELELRDGNGVSIARALAELGLDEPPREGGTLPGTFVELHVEQGPKLADLGAPLGTVSAIVGMMGAEVCFHGRPGHAGTTPMSDRADALCAAGAFALAVHAAASALRGAVATVGRIQVSPGAANVVPETASVSLDARAHDSSTLARLVQSLEAAAVEAAADQSCTFTIENRWQREPISMDSHVTDALSAAVQRRTGRRDELVSGALHDAGVLAAHGVATGMLFARSLNGGLSHAPGEHTDAQAVGLAVEVLTEALDGLAGAHPEQDHDRPAGLRSSIISG